jgi:hypothetical protein
MRDIEIQEYAQQLMESHGDRAVPMAANRACAFEQKRNEEESRTWRQIEAALKLMRGPHQS